MQVAKGTTALGTSVEDGLGIVAMVALEGAPGIWCAIGAEKSISVKSKQLQEKRLNNLGENQCKLRHLVPCQLWKLIK